MDYDPDCTWCRVVWPLSVLDPVAAGNRGARRASFVDGKAEGIMSGRSDWHRPAPVGFKGQNLGVEIEDALSGRFVYASERGHGSIVIDEVDGASGKLFLVGY